VKVVIYSFFFHAIVAVASTADFRGKVSAAKTKHLQLGKEAATLVLIGSGIVINILVP